MPERSADAAGDASFDSLLRLIEARARERRASGEVPADVEAELDRHFDAIVLRLGGAYDPARLDEALARVDAAKAIDPGAIAVDSSMPGGRAVHAAVAKVVGRQVAGLAAQMNEFTEAVTAALHEVARSLGDAGTHVHADLAGRLDVALGEAITALRGERSAADLVDPEAVDDLLRREFGEDPALDQPAATERHRVVVEIVPRGWGAGPAPSPARRIVAGDPSPAHLVLAAEPDASIDLAVVRGVFERLPPQHLAALVDGLAAKVRPGGSLVVRGLRPDHPAAAAHQGLDPRIHRLLDPRLVELVLRGAGFTTVQADGAGGDGPTYGLLATR